MAFIVDADRATHDFDKGRVNFYAELNGKRVYAAVSDEAIQDLTGTHSAEPGELVELFRSNQGIVAAIAEEKCRADQIESDGYVVVKSADLSASA